MGWILTAVAVLVLGIAAVAATGRFGGTRQFADRDLFVDALPPTRLTGRDLSTVRFGVTARGYAVDQVDGLLDRLARELAARDEELDWLRQLRLAEVTPDPSPLTTGTEDAE